MGGQKKGFQDRRVPTTVVLVPTRSPFHFDLAKELFSIFRFMEGKWLKVTTALASMLGSTYRALMQRSKFILNIIKG